jgi:hypothetical protein
MLDTPRDLFHPVLSMFVQGGSDIADGSAGEYENPLFLHDLWFTLNGLKDDLLPLLLNLKDSARTQTHIVPHMLRDNNPSESIQRCFHDMPPIWQFSIPNGNCLWEEQKRKAKRLGSGEAQSEKLKAESEKREADSSKVEASRWGSDACHIIYL